MATITDTTGTTLEEQGIPSGWLQWTPIMDLPSKAEDGSTLTGPLDPDGKRPFEREFPEDFYPFTDFRIGADFNTSKISVDAVDYTALAGGTPMGVGIMMGLGNPSSMVLKWRRVGSSGVLGSQRISVMPISPRVGYSIGNHFKHQAYMYMDIFGFGWAVLLKVNWLSIEGYGGIEYSANSRLKTAFLKHGLVQSVRFEVVKDINPTPANQNDNSPPSTDIFIKILNSIVPPHPDIASVFKNKKINIFSRISVPEVKMVMKTYTILSLTDQWEVKVNSRESSGSDHDIYVSAGDFFGLHQTFLIEDPALLHEFNLSLDLFGTVITSEQIRGIGDLELEIIPPVAASTATATATATATSESTSIRYLIKKGGSYNPIGSKYSVGSLPCGNRWSQNTCAQNLVGEFITIKNSWYQIIGHPRANIIDVYSKSVSSTDSLSPTENISGKENAIIQQKMWVTNEFYNGTGLLGSAEGFLNGGIKTITESETSHILEWTSEAWERKNAVLYTTEQSKWGVPTLTQRYLKDLTIPADGYLIKAYKKFFGWRLYHHNSKKVFMVNFDSAAPLVVTDAPTDSSPFMVNVKIDLLSSTVGTINAGDKVSIFFDEPYPTLYGSGDAAPTSLLKTDRSLDREGNWSALMMGFYDSGYRKMESPVEKDTVLSIVSYGVGVDVFPTPYYVATVKSKSSAIAAVYDHWPVPMDMVFYSGTQDNLLLMRRGTLGWKELVTQHLVSLGMGTTNSSDGYYVKEVGYENVERDNYFWVALDNGQSAFPYFSQKITGGGGVSTPFSRKSQITETPGANTYLPVEYYSGSEGKLSINAFYKSSITTEPYLEKANAEKLKAIIQGLSPPPGNSGSAIGYKRHAKRKEVIKDVGVQDVHYLPTGEMYLVYGGNCDEMGDFGDTAPTPNKEGNFESAPCVYIARSDNKGKSWGAGHLKTPSESDSSTVLDEWGTPLMVLYDFNYAGSVVDKKAGSIWIFGYVYEEFHDGEKDYMSLSAYRFFLPHLNNQSIQKLYSAKNNSNTVWIRPMGLYSYHGRKSTYNVSNNSENPAIADNGPAIISGGESFYRIYGGSLGGTSANGEPTLINEMRDAAGPLFSYGDVISIQYKGGLSIYVSKKNSGLISYVSGNNGQSWEDPEEGVQAVVNIPSAVCPFSHGDYLFYFTADTLRVMRLGVTPIKSEIQTVASNVTPQRVAATTDYQGVTRVYFMNKNDTLTCYYTGNKGETWSPEVNW